MKNNIYSLVNPGTFVIKGTNIKDDTDNVIVHPRYLSICHADQRYFQGVRPPEVLARKLPMALLHEGIGQVVSDAKGEFHEGEWVVMVPNTPVEQDDIIAENYLRSSKFRASGFDGFMQDNIEMGRDRIVRLPETVDKEVAAFTEIASVSYHTINRFDNIAHKRRNRVGIWGDGNLAFLTSLIFKTRYPDIELCIFGIDKDKMADLTFADKVIDCAKIPDDLRVDHAFECVGGRASGIVINQIIDYINPEGTIAIMGVSEEPVPINTRMVLEKGLRIFGSSRSGAADFKDLIRLYENNPEMVKLMKKIIGETVEVHTVDDMIKAFEADKKMQGGKTVIIWNV